jgi:hypothetical protein
MWRRMDRRKSTIFSEKGSASVFRFKEKADIEDGSNMLIYRSISLYQVLRHYLPKDCAFVVNALRPANPTELKVWDLWDYCNYKYCQVIECDNTRGLNFWSDLICWTLTVVTINNYASLSYTLQRLQQLQRTKNLLSSLAVAWKRLPTVDFPLPLGSRTVPDLSYQLLSSHNYNTQLPQPESESVTLRLAVYRQSVRLGANPRY